MSRMGKKPVEVPSSVEVTVTPSAVKAKGPVGELEHSIPDVLGLEYDGDTRKITVSRKGDDSRSRALHGLHRSLISNVVQGVAEGFSKGMEIHGIGYGVDLKGKEVVLQIGFCHEVRLALPEGISVEIERNVAQPDRAAAFTVKGADRQLVGEFAAQIRRIRPPEPYKGKGIRYVGEQVRRKEGKALAGTER